MSTHRFAERMTLDELQTLHDDALVNRREAALFLGLSYSTLCFYATSGSGYGPPLTRLGWKTVRYRMSDLRAYTNCVTAGHAGRETVTFVSAAPPKREG